METRAELTDIVRHPGAQDHFVQLYQEPGALLDAVAEYIAAGLARGAAGIIIGRPEHRARLLEALTPYDPAQLVLLDAEETLARVMVDGAPGWRGFQQVVGGLIAQLRLRYPTVRAYGEMVDVLWQAGRREAAIRLEEYWNELGRLQTFSLFCGYRVDPLDAKAYGGALESICRMHTHLVPCRERPDFDAEVKRASRKLLDEPLAQILLSLAANHRSGTQMALGQATLFWLKKNMPRTAERVLSELRERAAPAD